MARKSLCVLVGLVCVALAASAGTAAAKSRALGVTWMQSYSAPGTPAKYNKVGVLKVGPADAKNVLVLEPGTSAGSAYFVPLAKWLVANVKGWQVWSVERRENLFEDQSEMNLAKQGKANATQLFGYYLGYLTDHSITKHFQSIPDSSVEFAKQWGMNVAVQDLHRVIAAARKLGGRVVLGGHSLGGSVVTAYATWDFGGKAGADQLAGLIYIDGSSFTPVSVASAKRELSSLDAATVSPWLDFGGLPTPYAGLFVDGGAVGALLAPNQASLGQAFPLLPSDLKPPVPVTNAAQFGYALNYKTSPVALLAAQAHLGQGLSSTPTNGLYGWNSTGALTPINRFATMFAGWGIQNVDGDEWYFPQRLTDDTGAINNGIKTPVQSILDVHATMGRKLPKDLMIYAFGARLGGEKVLDATRALARQSHIPMHNLTLVNRQGTYSHNDPVGAYPNNIFFTHLVEFLRKLAG
jgi:pimeloyl-ACP methyl ester carboxylesterase